MKRTASILGASLVIVTYLCASLQATQIIYRSPKQLGEESSLVILGKVREVHSYWNENGSKIFTETVVEVDESYKGQAGPVIRIVQLGGVVGNVRMTVHGALHWRPGEEVLLFLEPYRNEGFQVSGFSQGKFEIERDPANGRPFVKHPRLDSVEILRAPGEAGDAPAPHDEKMPLHKFVNEILGLR